MQQARQYAKEQMIIRGLTHDKDAIKALDMSRSDGDRSVSRSPSHSPPRHRSAAATADDRDPEGGPLQLMNMLSTSNNSEPNEALAAITRARRVAAGLPPRHPDSTPRKGQKGPRQLVTTEGNQWGHWPGGVPFDNRRFDEERNHLQSGFWAQPTSPRRHSLPGRTESPRKC